MLVYAYFKSFAFLFSLQLHPVHLMVHLHMRRAAGSDLRGPGQQALVRSYRYRCRYRSRSRDRYSTGNLYCINYLRAAVRLRAGGAGLVHCCKKCRQTSRTGHHEQLTAPDREVIPLVWSTLIVNVVASGDWACLQWAQRKGERGQI